MELWKSLSRHFDTLSAMDFLNDGRRWIELSGQLHHEGKHLVLGASQDRVLH